MGWGHRGHHLSSLCSRSYSTTLPMRLLSCWNLCVLHILENRIEISSVRNQTSALSLSIGNLLLIIRDEGKVSITMKWAPLERSSNMNRCSAGCIRRQQGKLLFCKPREHAKSMHDVYTGYVYVDKLYRCVVSPRTAAANVRSKCCTWGAPNLPPVHASNSLIMLTFAQKPPLRSLAGDFLNFPLTSRVFWNFFQLLQPEDFYTLAAMLQTL